MNRPSWRMPFFLLVVHLLAPRLYGEPTSDVNYSRDIKPLLKARCYACHGALKQEAGLRLDSGTLIRSGGTQGAVVTPGMKTGSLLLRIQSHDLAERMPPEGEPLSAEQIQKISAWVEQGAVSPDGEKPESDPRQHWAFQTPVRPAVPPATHPEWIRNPIDAFIAQEHDRRQLQPQPTAAKVTLLRRITLDLTGLPPTREELKAFLADESPEAYAAVVDRLLNSAQYGERWGRHWMDVWRYADWYGRRYVPDVWNSAPQIWRWRDWIVKSLNEDKSYAQMVAEMLAGDEVAPEDDEAGYATGYLIRNWYALNPNDWMRSNVEHTGKAFLGLTFNCAHCHDHKYDPISQDDYFRFRAFFEPISIRQERVPGEADPGPFQEYNYSTLRKVIRLGGVSIFDKAPEAPTWFYTGGDERNRVTERGSIKAGVPALFSANAPEVATVQLPARAWYPGLRPAIHETVLNEQRAALAAAESQLPAVRDAVAGGLAEPQSKLALAEAEFEAARLASQQAGRSAALAGRQSLVVDSTTGRRILQNRLQQIQTVSDQCAVRFQLQIVKDTHVNFQLAKDVVKGLTAGYVGFEGGRIMSYQPGTFSEFEVGKYNFAGGQNRFEVSLLMQGDLERCQLTVRSLSDGVVLVDNIPVARNGWKIGDDPTKGISFDIRPGSVAALDDIVFVTGTNDVSAVAGPSPSSVRFDFEPPVYRDHTDVMGIDGWIGSSFSVAGAKAFVSSTYGDETLKPLSDKVFAARRTVDAVALKLSAIETKRAACVAQLQSTNARIAADRAKYGETPGANVEELSRVASQQYREAAVLLAQAELLAKDQALAAAEIKPADDPNRAKELETASQAFAAATAVVEASRTALADPAQAASYPGFSPTYPPTSTGRRKALAEWIASRQNPLTARVAVNHIWLRHFHSPLVATVADFGRNGALPTHPELLDWLAVELMESGWSMKHVHRLIVTSNTYLMSSSSSQPENPARQSDPENKFLWRMNAGRMEAEVIRDSLLFAGGQLDLTMGGQELENSQALTTRRRTLYYSCQPEIDGKSSFGALFDAPEPADCYRRSRSIIPQQALALTNSDLIHEISGLLTTALWQSLTPDQQTQPTTFIVTAYERILTRQPTEAELAACIEFLKPASDDAAEMNRLRESLVRALLNHNDFVSIR